MAVGLLTNGGRGRRLDVDLFRKINAGAGPAADRVFRGITELGSIFGSVGVATALSLAGRRRAAGRALQAAGATWVAGQLLKKAFRRPRPYDALPGQGRLLIGRPRGTSWPSSHPAVLIAFLTVAERELDLGSAPRRALLALAGAVGLSRTVLGVHYPSDVAGGLLIGRAIGQIWP